MDDLKIQNNNELLYCASYLKKKDTTFDHNCEEDDKCDIFCKIDRLLGVNLVHVFFEDPGKKYNLRQNHLIEVHGKAYEKIFDEFLKKHVKKVEVNCG